MLSLMTLAAEDGAETTFEQIRRSITTGSMPPDMKVDYFIHLGKARRALQQEHMAEIAFSKAIEIAEAHGLGRLLFEAESELRASQYAIEAMPSKEPPPALVDVADAIRTMRLETLVTQDA
jgi:hypothetical protein